ncbi:hypothetical protein [Lysobacter sp. CFH 32150]|uniref:hypothetical protein n=1 Tax=Lysobacter sp. CFH 32150 TaxID=2927128 RepID=UPI001FA7E785|nr:hypothetical protein [Lysobacter sp. CFH 32150]MCI4566498.1 hypothetical protein [Lysobacter sp. CFH 32150]
MKSSLLIAFLLALIAAPAAGKSNIPPTDAGQIVLLVNALEPELTHTHLGVTAFTNYENKIPNDWKLSATIEGRARELLTGTGYRVVVASVPDEQLQMIRSRRHVKMGWSSARPSPDFAKWLEAEMSAQGATVAIILGTYRRKFAFNVPVSYEGYGVMSMHGKTPKHAYLFANVYASVFSGEPLGIAEGASFNESDCRAILKPNEIAVDSFESLSADLLAPYRQTIEALAGQRLKQDLTASGLIAGEVEKCTVPIS